MKFPDDLQVGDILLYAGPTLADLGIEWKEGDDVAHVESYAGNGMSRASRNGIGVNIYPFRQDGLKYVRRCHGTPDEESIESWFKDGVKGLAYGWQDILDNLSTQYSGFHSSDIKYLKGVDCSHYIAAEKEVGKQAQFDPEFPKNKVTPRDFKLSMGSYQIYP